MDTDKILTIFDDTAYVRMGGSPEELKAAQYLADQCTALGLNATLESFPVQMANIEQAVLTVDGKEITCKGYLNAGSADIEAPLYYLRGSDPYSLSLCKGKIVLVDGYLGYWVYQDLLANGAVGFITYDGNANYIDRDIDQRELRGQLWEGKEKLPGFNINAKDAIEIINSG